MRVRCDTFKNESSVLEEATSASISAVVHPESSKAYSRRGHFGVQPTQHDNMHRFTIGFWPFPLDILGNGK